MASGEEDDSYDYGYPERTATASATVSNSSSSREPFRFTSSHLQKPDVVSYRHDVGTRSDCSSLLEAKTSTAIDRMVGSTTKASGDDAYAAIDPLVDQPKVDHHQRVNQDMGPSTDDRLRALEESLTKVAAILERSGQQADSMFRTIASIQQDQLEQQRMLTAALEEQNRIRSSLTTNSSFSTVLHEKKRSQQAPVSPTSFTPVVNSFTPGFTPGVSTPISSYSTPQYGSSSPAQDATLISRAMAKDFTPLHKHVRKLDASLRGTPKGVLAFANLRRGLENYAAERGTPISSMPCVKLEEFLDPQGWEFSKLERAKFRNPSLTVGEALSMIEKPWSSASSLSL